MQFGKNTYVYYKSDFPSGNGFMLFLIYVLLSDKHMTGAIVVFLLCGLFYEAICFMSCLVLFCSCVFQSF